MESHFHAGKQRTHIVRDRINVIPAECTNQTLDDFLNVFRQTTQPFAAKDDENSATMLVYQAGMAGTLRQILEVLKGNAVEQTAGKIPHLLKCI